MRMIFGKVMWVGRATVFLVGLAVILALTVGVVSKATAHTGSSGLFHLGHSNAARAISSLVGTVSGGMLQVTNNSTATTAKGLGVTNKSGVSPAVKATNSGGGPALGLSVASGKAPMTVNATAGKATNLDADKVDGKSATDFYAAGSKVADSSRADFAESAGHADTAVSAASADNATNAANAANADQLNGKDSTQFANAAHAHTGTDITSGAVPEAHIDTLVTRDSEVMSIAKSNDGPGSGLGADTLDNQDSSAFAGSGESSYGISTTLTPCTDQVLLSRTFSPSRPALIYASGASVYNQGDSNLTSGGLRLELRNTADNSVVAAGAYMRANANGNEVPLSVQGVLVSGNDHNSVWNSSTPYEVIPGNSYNLRLVAMSTNGSCAGSPRMGNIALSYLLIGK